MKINAKLQTLDTARLCSEWCFCGSENQPSVERIGICAHTDLHFARPITRGAFQLTTKQSTNVAKAWLRANLPDEALTANTTIDSPKPFECDGRKIQTRRTLCGER